MFQPVRARECFGTSRGCMGLDRLRRLHQRGQPTTRRGRAHRTHLSSCRVGDGSSQLCRRLTWAAAYCPLPRWLWKAHLQLARWKGGVLAWLIVSGGASPRRVEDRGDMAGRHGRARPPSGANIPKVGAASHAAKNYARWRGLEK